MQLSKHSIRHNNDRTAHNRKARGQALMELSCALLVVIPIILFLFDSLFIFLGESMNDSICRDAARAAAAGPPSLVDSSATPKQRADAVIKNIYFSVIPMKVRPLKAADVIEDVTPTDVPPKTVGGGVGGRITVATTVDVYPPFILGFFSSNHVVLKARHTVPVTYVVPPSPSP